MAEKSPQAFRTIREVAEWLDIEAHVLRFWESKFTQIKPVKRAGGRRYYRPADMKLIGGIKILLHDQGLTIRGAQKKLADDGVAAISALSPPLAEDLEAEAAATLTIDTGDAATPKDGATSQAGFFDIEALAGDSAAPEEEEAEPQTEAPAPPEDAAEPDPSEAEVAPEATPAADADHAWETVPPPAPTEEPATADAPEDPSHDTPPATPADTGPGEEAPPPPTPLSEIRVLLHEAVPLSDEQRARLAPMVGRLMALATRLNTGHPGE